MFGEEEGEVDDEGGTGGDRESAEVFLKWMTDEGHRFVRSGKDIWWYRPEYGVYSQDMGELKMEGESDSKGLRSRIAECPLLDNEYRSMTKKQNDLKVQFLEMIPHDGKLYDRMFNSTLRKIAFQNGVYDFEKKGTLALFIRLFLYIQSARQFGTERKRNVERRSVPKVIRGCVRRPN